MSTGSDEQLRTRLHAALGTGPPNQGDWDDVLARGERPIPRPAGWPPRRSLLLATAVAATVIIAVAILAVMGDTSSQRVHTVGSAPPSTASPTSSPAPSSSPNPTKPKLVIDTTLAVPLGTSVASGLEAMPDGAWVALWGTGQVIRVDGTGRVTARLTLGATADSGPLGIAQGEGALWILAFTSTHQLLRVNPTTGEVTRRLTIPGEAERVAVGHGAVWVAACCAESPPVGGSNHRLYRIDPDTVTIERSVTFPGDGDSDQIEVGATGVYVDSSDVDTIAQIDAAGTRIVSQPNVGDECELVAMPLVGCFVNDINNPNGGTFVEVDEDGRTTTISTPGPVNTATTFDGHLVVATPLDLYELDGARWRLLGEHPAVSELSASAGTLWAVQGNQVQRLAQRVSRRSRRTPPTPGGLIR